SRKEVARAGLLKAALAGKISNAQGAHALHLSVRQFQRLKVRFTAEGARGLLHGLRGRPSPRRVPAPLYARAAALLQTPYAGLNDCHATEKLREVEGVPLSRSSVRRLRRALGLPAKRRRRGRQVRTRRTPEAQRGALVPLDASPFPWLRAGRRRLPAGQGPHRTLLANPAGSPRRRVAAARHRHPGRRQRILPRVPRRPHRALCAGPGPGGPGLAAAAPRSGRAPELPLYARRGPRQHGPPRAPLASAATPALLCRPAP